MANRKLTEEDVKQIWELKEQQRYHAKRARELSDAKIAEKFGVKTGCVQSIFYTGNWSQVV